MCSFKQNKGGFIAVLALSAGGCLSVQAAIPANEIVEDVTGADIGSLNIGGAIRANYVYGEDYGDSAGPSRGDNGGTMELDVFRINVDWQKNDWVAKGEYRWYQKNWVAEGYNFFHTAWIGYNFDEASQLQVGLNRVPFGVGAYGPANSWFFDLHYYIGLSDDMDLGAKYTHSNGAVSYDLAVYAAPEFNGNGATDDSARYSYDIVDDGTANGVYKERGQLNGRIVFTIATNSIPTDLGASLQLGMLKANDSSSADDAFSYAASVHSSSTLGPWNLKLQCTTYDHGVDFNDAAVSDDLVQMGAYDYAVPIAAKGIVPAATLSYTWGAERYDWLDSVTFLRRPARSLKMGKITPVTT